MKQFLFLKIWFSILRIGLIELQQQPLSFFFSSSHQNLIRFSFLSVLFRLQLVLIQIKGPLSIFLSFFLF